MLSSIAARAAPRTAVAAVARRCLASEAAAAEGLKVSVLGAAGGIGQPLSMLLKLNQHVSHLSLFDVVNTPGVAADLSHISSPAQVSGVVGMESIGEALQGCDVVVIPAGVPRKPGMSRDDLFTTNARIVYNLAVQCADHCPEATLLVISNPVNSTVPIVAETLRRRGLYQANKLFGVTTLDVVRAKTFVADARGWDPRDTHVDVIGGHAGRTIIPLLSRVQDANFTDEEIEALTHRIQFGGDEVVQAKDGLGSATLSMAYAGAYFTGRILEAMLEQGAPPRECAFVESHTTDAPFFSLPVNLRLGGNDTSAAIGDLSDVERANLEEAIPTLIQQAEKGVQFVKEEEG